jgi:hypothetical protein
MKPLNITPEEKEEIVKEIAERLKDTVYANAYRKVADALNNIDLNSLETMREIEVNYKLVFTTDDVAQILGRIRRANEEKKRKRVGARND